MADLYNRKGVMLQGTGIKAPLKRANVWGKAFELVAKETGRIAKENYALGKAQLINYVLTTAYQQAPDNIQQFNELVESGFEKGLQGLDPNTQETIKQAANDKVKSLQLKVGQNLNNRLDAENSEKVINMANDTIYGLGGLYDLNQRIGEAIIDGKRDEVDKLNQLKKNAINKYMSLANSKNMRGKNILGRNAVLGFQKENESGMFATIRDSIMSMDVDELKTFDEGTLQNREGFLAKTGLSANSYDKLVKLVQKQGKALDENYKREVRSQNQLTLAMQFADYNPEELEKAREFIPEDLYDELKNTMERAQKTPVNTALRTNEDDNFNNQFAMLFDVINSKPDGTDDYNDRLLKSAAQAKNAITRYRQLDGSTEELSTVVDNILQESLSNQMFADVISPSFAEGTALHELVVNNPYYQEIGKINLDKRAPLTEDEILLDRYVRPVMGNANNIPNNDNMTRLYWAHKSINKNDILTPEKQKQKQNVLKAGISEAISMVTAAKNLPEDQQAQVYEQIHKYMDDLNKEIIRINVSPIINRPTMDRLEKELANGKEAVFNVGSRVMKFKGFTDNDIIVEEEY